jgi:hypothetical protein
LNKKREQEIEENLKIFEEFHRKRDEMRERANIMV